MKLDIHFRFRQKPTTTAIEGKELAIWISGEGETLEEIRELTEKIKTIIQSWKDWEEI